MLSWLLHRTRPEDVVVLADDGAGSRRPITAEQLVARVRQLREVLGDVENRGVWVGTTRPVAFLVAALAALEAGAVVIPVNLRSSVAQQKRQQEALRPARIVTDAGVTVGAASPRAFDPRVGLVLTTSGSSGTPRHVQLGTEGLRANIDAILSYLPLRQHPRPGIVLPLWYSYALVGQALAGLRGGATLVLLNDEAYPVRQLAAMREHAVDGLSSVPSSLLAIAETALDLPAEQRPRLAYLASAGEPLSERVVDAVRAAFPGARLYNQYGLTEASPRVAAIADTDPGFAVGAAGYPLPGITITCRHADGRPCREDDPAELLVQGPSLMLGYLDDTEATARVLGEGGLRTGDLGWVDESGRVFVVARRDDIVKVRGEKVSLAQVERTLLEHAETHEAVVLGFPDPTVGTRVVAFVCTSDPDGVRDWARERLAAVGRPSRWYWLEQVPRNANGKVDRAALRKIASGSVRYGVPQ